MTALMSSAPEWKPSFTVIQRLAFWTPFLLSILAICAFYNALASRYATLRQRSWILTTLSSGVMTVSSLSFVWDYLESGGSVKGVRHIPAFSYAVNRFFQSYLISDLIMGALYYRSEVALLTGWIHHFLYVLVVEVAIRRSWAHIFCLCAAMELPTFILGLSTLYPRLRSNVLFAASFFVTRITFHVVLCISYLLPKNRAICTGGSYLPSLILTTVFPLHAMWFHGCIKGFIKRSAKSNNTPVVVALEVAPVQRDNEVPLPAPRMEESNIELELEIRSAQTSRIIVSSSSPARPRLTIRRPSFERAINALRLDLIEAQTAARKLKDAQERIYNSLPGRERLYDFVGLGRNARGNGMTVAVY